MSLEVIKSKRISNHKALQSMERFLKSQAERKERQQEQPHSGWAQPVTQDIVDQISIIHAALEQFHALDSTILVDIMAGLCDTCALNLTCWRSLHGPVQPRSGCLLLTTPPVRPDSFLPSPPLPNAPTTTKLALPAYIVMQKGIMGQFLGRSTGLSSPHAHLQSTPGAIVHKPCSQNLPLRISASGNLAYVEACELWTGSKWIMEPLSKLAV
eukprot:g41760.t1